MSQDQRAVLELLYKVSREFASALDLHTVLTRVLFAALNNVGGERGTIIVMDDNGRAIDSAIAYGNQLRESTTLQLRDTVERGLAGWVVRKRQAVLVPDTSKDSRWLRREDDAIDRSGAKSALCVPLMAREKVVGVLTIVHSIPKAYGDDHLELMQAIADQAGIAVLNARLFSESQRQARVMTVLAEGAASLSMSVRMDDIFESILAQTKQALQVEIAALALVDGEEVVFRAASGPRSEGLILRRTKIGDGIAGLVVREGRGVVIPAIVSETLLSGAEKIPGVLVRALACAPIHVQGKVIGVIEAFNPTNKIFDPDSLLVLTGLGSLAGSAIQNGELFQSLDLARKRYLDLFDDSIDPIVITDLEGKILEANRQASRFSGHPIDDLQRFLIGQMHDVNFEKTGHSFEKVSDTTLYYESTLYSQQGTTYPVGVYVRKVTFDGQEAIQWIMRDIRERKELDALREDLAAMIYHDLRSPLANILSSVEMLGSSISDAEKETAAPILKIARHSIDRIQRLISSLLDLNRLEQNQPVTECQAVALDFLLGEVLEAVSPARDGRNQTIEIKLEENLRDLYVDVDMIRRVLINLTENAVKYTPVNGHIVIGAEAEGEFIRIFVQDDGPGIPEIDRERIFDKFTRLKNKTGARGLGVGLAFCKLAVQGHGGKIWVEPAPEHGAKFVFTLPMVA
jgi:PAS domain S-box-containing protein